MQSSEAGLPLAEQLDSDIVASSGAPFPAAATPSFTAAFDAVFASAGVAVVRTAPRAPQANAFAQRWVRTVRGDCLDRTLVWNERQLQRVLTQSLAHDNTARPHRALARQPPAATPTLTAIEPATATAPVERVDVLGGLIHEYRRAA